MNKLSSAAISKLGRLNHVAIAVPNITATALFYKNILHANVSEPVALPAHGVTTVFVDLGNTKLELLQPLGEKSPISKFLIKNPAGGIHHVCIEVSNLLETAKQLNKNGVRSLDPEPKIGAHGLPVMFFHPKDFDGVLMEFEEHSEASDK